MYYVLDGTIYQAPSLYSILEVRFLSCLRHLDKAFNTVNSRAKFDPVRGCYWEFQEELSEETGAVTGMVDRDSGKYKNQIHSIIEDLGSMRQFQNPHAEAAAHIAASAGTLAAQTAPALDQAAPQAGNKPARPIISTAPAIKPGAVKKKRTKSTDPDSSVPASPVSTTAPQPLPAAKKKKVEATKQKN